MYNITAPGSLLVKKDCVVNQMETFREHKDLLYRSLVFVFFILILFIHLYRLGELPVGMEVDEVGMAYDAWCIGNFGVDRYLKSFPVYLNNYGGGQSVLYCYLAVPFVKNVGFSALMARIPGFIFSMLTCLFGFLLIKKIRGKAAGLIYLFIFAALPYFTQAGRIALDCNLMLGCSVIILYVLEYCLRQDEKKLLPYLLLGVITGISLYSYALSNMIYPIFFLLLYPFLRICGKRISLRQILVFMVPAVIIAVPLILVQVVNIWQLQDMHLGPLTIPRIIDYRLKEVSLSEIRPNITWIYRSLFTADNQEFDSFPQFGALYKLSIPVIIAGCVITLVRTVKAAKNRQYIFDGVILLFTAVMMLIALVLLGVTTYRINAVFFGLAFMIVGVIDACLMRTMKPLQPLSLRGTSGEGARAYTPARGNESSCEVVTARGDGRAHENGTIHGDERAREDVTARGDDRTHWNVTDHGDKRAREDVTAHGNSSSRRYVLTLLAKMIGAGLILAYAVSAFFFLNYYFTGYERDYLPQRLFSENPRQVYEFLESRSDEIRGRTTHVAGSNEAYAYYLLAMGISPYDYDVNRLGNNGDGDRFIFYAPEPYDSCCNYVFYMAKPEYRQQLTVMGFTEYRIGNYSVFLNE